MRLFATWFASTVALAFAAWVLGDHMSFGDSGDDLLAKFVTIGLVGLIFTVIHGFIAPVVKTLSLPFVVVTLGLALLVINALLLLLTEWVSQKIDLSFYLDGFWWAVVASIVISIAQSIVGAIVRD